MRIIRKVLMKSSGRIHCLVLAVFFLFSSHSFAAGKVEVFAGSASKPPLDEITKNFKNKTGIDVEIHYGGSGTVLSQMIISKRGDVYIPGSSDFLDIARKKGVIEKDNEKILAYLVPVISVQKGNPKKIKGIHDLLRDDLKIAVGSPKTVCIGLYAIEIFYEAKISEKMKKNIATYTESCEKTANLITLKAVDAVVGWDVFEKWNPKTTETVKIDKKYVKRVGYIPAAVSKFSKDKKSAEAFINYTGTKESRKIFQKWGYIIDFKEIKEKYGNVKVGGDYRLEEGW